MEFGIERHAIDRCDVVAERGEGGCIFDDFDVHVGSTRGAVPGDAGRD